MMLIQVQLPSIAITRLLLQYDLLNLAKIYLHQAFKKSLVKLATKQVKRFHMPFKHEHKSLASIKKKTSILLIELLSILFNASVYFNYDFDLFFRYYTFKNPAICLVKTILEFQVLQDFWNCDKKSKKLQEFLNDKIQNSLFCSPLCLNMSKNGFPAKTGLCRFVNNKIA